MRKEGDAEVLTTSFDGEARLFAMKSGQKIKEYTGHESYMNLGRFSPDHSSVVTVSSDGKVCFRSATA